VALQTLCFWSRRRYVELSLRLVYAGILVDKIVHCLEAMNVMEMFEKLTV